MASALLCLRALSSSLAMGIRQTYQGGPTMASCPLGLVRAVDHRPLLIPWPPGRTSQAQMAAWI